MKRALGIDIGGTKIALAAIDESGRTHASATIPTHAAAGFPNALGRIQTEAAALLERAHWSARDLQGIGIGCAGPVNPLSGTIHNPFTLPGWENSNIVEPLAAHFDQPVFLENDADAALLGEHYFGAGRGSNPTLMLTFGTGIGGALLRDGVVWRGSGGEHPEAGHIPVIADGPACYCGRSGCLESLASGTAIQCAGKNLGFESAREVFRAMQHGHVGATGIINRSVMAVATAVWTFVHTLYPQRILFGGGLMEEHFELFAEAARREIHRATMVSSSTVEIVQAELGNAAALCGAASLVFQFCNPSNLSRRNHETRPSSHLRGETTSGHTIPSN